MRLRLRLRCAGRRLKIVPQGRIVACLGLLAAVAFLLAAPRQAAPQENGDAPRGTVLRLRTVAGADGGARARRTFSMAT